jgi:hypothetical protein
MTKTKAYILTFAAATALTLFSCTGTQTGHTNAPSKDTVQDTTIGPMIKFDTAVFNFGRILQGEQVSTVFKFTNIGDADLIIQKVETSCGCTVPEYDRAPVKPGQTGAIRVRFDSDGKEGSQYKTVKVTSNCKENIFDLVVVGEVETR